MERSAKRNPEDYYARWYCRFNQQLLKNTIKIRNNLSIFWLNHTSAEFIILLYCIFFLFLYVFTLHFVEDE